jgi:hypothetical protein
VALVAVPSLAIVESYVGGSAVHGFVEDGHYFVNPGHGRPIAEVSESTWRRVYWVELLWPWSALVSGFAGLFLTTSGMGPNWKSPPAPPLAELPPRVLWACLLGAGITVAGTGLCLFVVRTPWVVMLVGWILFCVSSGTIVWWYTRSWRDQQTGEPGAAPDPRCASEERGALRE